MNITKGNPNEFKKMEISMNSKTKNSNENTQESNELTSQFQSEFNSHFNELTQSQQHLKDMNGSIMLSASIIRL